MIQKDIQQLPKRVKNCFNQSEKLPIHLILHSKTVSAAVPVYTAIMNPSCYTVYQQAAVLVVDCPIMPVLATMQTVMCLHWLMKKV